jgi:hypothetical protein
MSPKLARIETGLEAMVFQSDSVRFEPCTGFRPSADLLVCQCGWLEDDHPEVLAASVSLPLGRLRRRARRTVAMPERRAS